MYCNVLQIYSPQIGPKLHLKPTNIWQNYVCLVFSISPLCSPHSEFEGKKTHTEKQPSEEKNPTILEKKALYPPLFILESSLIILIR